MPRRCAIDGAAGTRKSLWECSLRASDRERSSLGGIEIIGWVECWKDCDRLTVPPFVPNRILAQRCFARTEDSDAYVRTDAVPIHVKVDSEINLQRRVSEVAPGAAVIWYSRQTNANRQGAVMAYVPSEPAYWTWYAALRGGDEWTVAETKDILREQLERLAASRSRTDAD